MIDLTLGFLFFEFEADKRIVAELMVRQNPKQPAPSEKEVEERTKTLYLYRLSHQERY